MSISSFEISRYKSYLYKEPNKKYKLILSYFFKNIGSLINKAAIPFLLYSN